MNSDDTQMKAVTIPEFGDAGVLRADTVPIPVPGPGQVAIDVAYAGANFAEVLYRRGVVDVPLPFVPGIEVAGYVRAVGEGVEDLWPGRPVAALTIVDSGGYAEVAVTSADLVAPLDGLDIGMGTAAALPSNSTTAFLVLDRVARIAPGESVLVHAAAGGVGSQLGQAARLLGAGRVVGTVGSASKIDTAKGFGYDEVILRDRLADAGRFDIVVDMVGGSTRRASLDRLASMGRLVIMGNASGAQDVGVPANELWFTNRTVSGFNLAAFAAAHPDEAGRALRRAVEAVAKGELRVQVEALPLERVAEAHRRIEAGATTGKLVLDVAAL
ncbi:quinone oxidoreductase family protein [Streptomyces violaceusniger]|uniref:Alcohol dehydrogenase zinc-binding domain protein n=1 Tax=Streptomyces violaceusniger (strain Tu 4113) TaxID=653045 RepID=G2P810_STRV4|nr:zinc-binding dehydrogenase [Streptomyces violaceusniger]AEM85671.1 Alcohol dehydrogenase zinc-binding domain protein [Streptomyces violaceusniger Tu 4113]